MVIRVATNLQMARRVVVATIRATEVEEEDEVVASVTVVAGLGEVTRNPIIRPTIVTVEAFIMTYAYVCLPALETYDPPVYYATDIW